MERKIAMERYQMTNALLKHKLIQNAGNCVVRKRIIEVILALKEYSIIEEFHCLGWSRKC